MFGQKKLPPIKSLLAHGNYVKGDIEFSEGLRIDGLIVGNLRAKNEWSIVVISDMAKVVGEIHAAHVVVNGHVQGPIYASELLELQSKAHVEGDVHYKSLEMHKGAAISGQLKPMLQGESPAPSAEVTSFGTSSNSSAALNQEENKRISFPKISEEQQQRLLSLRNKILGQTQTPVNVDSVS